MAVTINEKRNRPNQVAAKGNVAYSRSVEMVFDASEGAGTFDVCDLPPGTVVLGVVLDTDTSFGATTIALATATGGITVVSAATLTTTGGVAAAINDAMAVQNVAGADDTLQLTTSAASPASEVKLNVTLILAALGPVDNVYETYTT